MASRDQIRTFLQTRIAAAAAAGGGTPPDLRDEFNLVQSGLFDSLTFVGLIAALEQALGIELDLGDLEPQEFTTLGGLIDAAVRSPAVES